MIIWLNNAHDEPELSGPARPVRAAAGAASPVDAPAETKAAPKATLKAEATSDVAVDVLQRPLKALKAPESARPAWLGSIAPAQRYSKQGVALPQRLESAASAAASAAAGAAITSAESSSMAATVPALPVPAGSESNELSELERTQVVTAALSMPYQVTFSTVAEPTAAPGARSAPLPRRTPGLRPIVLPDAPSWAAPPALAQSVALTRTGTVDDTLGALLQAPMLALDTVKDKLSELAQGAASVASLASKATLGGAKAESDARGPRIVRAVPVDPVCLEQALPQQQDKAKALGLGQGSRAIVDAQPVAAEPPRKGLLRGLVRRRRVSKHTAGRTVRALSAASSALSGLMALEQCAPLYYEDEAGILPEGSTPRYDVNARPIDQMDEDLTYEQWIKQQGVPFAALERSNLTRAELEPASALPTSALPTSTGAVEPRTVEPWAAEPVGAASSIVNGGCGATTTPVLQALRWKNELNSKSLEPWGTVPQERLTQRLNSYFLHADHFSESLKRAGRQHQMAAVLGYGIFRQWLQRRRSAQHEIKGMVAPSSESLFYYTALLLIETMIFAMRADGRIEQDEHDSLLEFGGAIFGDKLPEMRGELDRLLTVDIDPEHLAQLVQFPEESIDMYLLSAVILDGNCMLERSYLEALAACLGIDPTLRRRLDLRAHELVVGQNHGLSAPTRS
ncbi:MAG TPA: DUF533 domain-containing protein [Candidatus Anaerobiospirillum stercoravium]|nr:DUF533 domain-containing protein [Candidatus Anaerobiospirillum stercoravium]